MEQFDDYLVRQNSSDHLHFFYPKCYSVVPVFALTAMPSAAVPRSQDQKFHLSHQNHMPVAKIHFECPCISVTAAQPMTQNEMSHHH